MTSNEEIYLSYLCDRVMAACNRINKKLDEMADSYAPLQYPLPTYVTQPQPYLQQTYTTPVNSYHEQPSWHVATDVVQPRPPPDPPNGQLELYRHQFNPYPAAQPPYQPPTGCPPQPSPHHNHYQPNDYGPPSTEPVLCPLPQPTAAAPADLHSEPSNNSLPADAAPLPPTQRSPPATISLLCSPDMREQIREEEELLEYKEEDGFLKVSSLSPMSRHEALECIQIESAFCEKINNGVVTAIAICCPRVRKLGILGVHKVDAGAINAFAKHRQIWNIFGRVDELPILVLHCSDPKSPPLVIFEGNYEGRRSSIRCVFDPGGDTSTRFSLSPLFVESCFPP